MPTSKDYQRDPRPTGGSAPIKPEPNPMPVGGPSSDKAELDPQADQGSHGWKISTSKKVDDLSRHESKHDEKYTPKPNAREKVLDPTKPGAYPPPQGDQPRHGDLRK